MNEWIALDDDNDDSNDDIEVQWQRGYKAEAHIADDKKTGNGDMRRDELKKPTFGRCFRFTSAIHRIGTCVGPTAIEERKCISPQRNRT
jgi:hypothetical protein